MSFSSFSIIAEKRVKIGKRFNYKLRKNGKIPAIIYSGVESIPIFFDNKDSLTILKMLSSGCNLIKCEIDSKKFYVIVKDIHEHSFKREVLHFDFQRVDVNDIVSLRILLKFSDEKVSPGIKQGGFLVKHMSSVFIKTLVSKIPSYINVDLSKLNVNKSIVLSDLKIPKGITLPLLYKKETSGLLVASIVGSRVSEPKEVSK